MKQWQIGFLDSLPRSDGFGFFVLTYLCPTWPQEKAGEREREREREREQTDRGKQKQREGNSKKGPGQVELSH